MKFTVLILSTSLLTATAAPIVPEKTPYSPIVYSRVEPEKTPYSPIVYSRTDPEKRANTPPLYAGLAFNNEPGHNGKREVDTPYSIYAYTRDKPEKREAEHPKQLYTTKPPTYPLADEPEKREATQPDQTYDYLDYKHLPKRDVEVPYSIYAYTREKPKARDLERVQPYVPGKDSVGTK